MVKKINLRDFERYPHSVPTEYEKGVFDIPSVWLGGWMYQKTSCVCIECHGAFCLYGNFELLINIAAQNFERVRHNLLSFFVGLLQGCEWSGVADE